VIHTYKKLLIAIVNNKRFCDNSRNVAIKYLATYNEDDKVLYLKEAIGANPLTFLYVFILSDELNYQSIYTKEDIISAIQEHSNYTISSLQRSYKLYSMTYIHLYNPDISDTVVYDRIQTFLDYLKN
jgi:hypothetical protein